MSRVRWEFGEPNPKQDAAMRLTKRYIAYGGARGGGKSWMIRKKSTLNSLKHAGIKQLIITPTIRRPSARL